MEVTVNGVTYTEKPKIQKPRSVSYLIALAGIYGIRPRQEIPMPNLHQLAEEFERIQNKTSNCNRAERDHIVTLFHKYFTPKED